MPFWWPGIWVTHTILIIAICTALGWNYFEGTPMQDEVEENAELLKKQKGFGGDFFRAYYYNWASSMGLTKHFAGMLLLVGIAGCATVIITAATFRGIAAASLFF